MNEEEKYNEYMMHKQAQFQQEQMVSQGMLEEYVEPPTEQAEYVREFSKDRVWKMNEKGELIDGTIPRENLMKFWSINNPNFVFGNITQEFEKDKIQLNELDIVFGDRQYTINKKFLGQDNEAVIWAINTKTAIINNSNQRTQTYMKMTRAKNGKERELMVTRSLIAGTTTPDTRKGGIGGMISGFLGGGGK
jgi:hypothetical protein